MLKKIWVIFSLLHCFLFSQSITISYPNGEEEVVIGSSCIITWNSEGNIENLKIEYSIDGGNSFNTIVESTENDGIFEWQVPEVNADNGLIRISNLNGDISDTSDSTFHIIFCQNPANITFNLELECNLPENEFVSIKFESPLSPIKMEKNGEKWQLSLKLFNIGENIKYKYCRNSEDGAADEYFETTEKGWRQINIDNENMVINDTLTKWRWWPIDGNIPQINTEQYLSNCPSFLPKNNYIKGIMLPDWWKHSWIDSLEETLDKIVETNSEWIAYCPVPEITQFYPYPLIVREGNNGTSEDDLIKIIEESHKRGLKVFLNPFPFALTVTDTSDHHSEYWWRKYENQWRPIILYYAQIAENYNVEMLGFNMWNNLSNNEEIEIIDILSRNLLKDIRSIYSGKICIPFFPWGPNLQLFNDADYLSFKIADYWPWKLSDTKNPTVEEILNNLSDGIDNYLYPNIIKEKPFILTQFSAYSYDGAASGASGDPESLNPWYLDDEAWPIDLQEQADIIEAMLHAFCERNWIEGVFYFGYDYWNSIDKDINIRGKPSENVLKKWYKWINPESVYIKIERTEGGSTNPSSASYIKEKESEITISAISEAGYKFSKWEGDINPDQETQNPITIILNENKRIKAIFERIYQMGDINQDNIIDISDVILCLRQSIGLDNPDTSSADMNNDGTVDISDVILVLRKAIGLD